MNDYVHAVVSQRSCHQGRSANQRASKHLCEDCGNSSRRPDCGLGVPGAGPRSSAIHVHRQNARRDGLGDALRRSHSVDDHLFAPWHPSCKRSARMV